MANSIVKQTLIDGSRKLIVKINIKGDGTGEETNLVLIDASSYTPAFTDASLRLVHANLNGFTCDLIWDATVNVDILHVADYESNYLKEEIGLGLPNNAGAGKTGDILLSTIGLGANDHGTIILELNKRNA